MMKKQITSTSIFLLILYFLFSTGCSDYLEKPPSVDITVDSVYNNLLNAEKALADAYRGLPYPIPESWDNRYSIYAAFMDELTDIATEREASWGGALNWYKGNISINNYITVAGDDASRAKEQWFPDYYVNIRKALLVVRNIDRVPDASTSYLQQIKAEARLIAAINYYQMFINYGAVPFVGHALGVNEEVIAQRPTLQVFMDSLLNMLNQCIDDLPASIPPLDQAGRLTRASAYAMIARTYWFAASPLFNSSTPGYPYPAGDPDRDEHNQMICFMKEDPNLWVKAAEACKAAIDQAEREGYGLLATGDYGDDYNNDYYNVFNGYERGRPELIISTNKFTDNRPYVATDDVFVLFFRPNQWRKGVFTQNMVDMYDVRKTGLPQTDPSSGFNPQKPYEGLDTRFYETVVWHGARYSGNEYRFDVESSFWINNSGRSTGYLTRKFHPRNASEQSIFQWPYFRMADLYLMYAECLNEAYGPSHPDIYTYIGRVRARAGMPNFPQMTDKVELRERILNERTVELSLESSRFFDLRRWKREDIYKKTIWAAKIYDHGDGTIDIEKFDYPLAAIGQQRVWNTYWYYFPFPRAEVMKGYGLVQNPGWDDDNLVGRSSK
jgi:hypothetical protein